MTKRKYSKTFTQASLTQQHSKDSTDINLIMARYIKTGVLDHVAKYQPQYPINNMVDYQTSMNIVIKANEMFAELPSSVRKTFGNDPARFLDFVYDEKNHDKLQEMGLTDTPYTPTPTKEPTPAQPKDKKITPDDPAPASPAP